MSSSHAELFEDLDRMDVEAWVAHLAPDVVVRFANEDPIYGHASSRESVEALTRRVTSISHAVLARFEHGDTTVTEAVVTFGLPGRADAALPTVTIYRTDSHGLIVDYRVYLDPSPLTALPH